MLHIILNFYNLLFNIEEEINVFISNENILVINVFTYKTFYFNI